MFACRSGACPYRTTGRSHSSHSTARNTTKGINDHCAMPPRERPIHCDIICDEATLETPAKPCLMAQANRCLYAGTALEGKIKHGQPHLRASLCAPHETRNRGDAFMHISCVPVICIGPHLPRAALRTAYFEDAERRQLFLSFPGMEKLQSDSDRNAVASYWSAAIEANLEENVDTPSDRLRFASYTAQ